LDGRSHEKWFQRRGDAERFVAQIEASKTGGMFFDPQAGRLVFAAAANRWLATRGDKARSTRDRDSSYLRNIILPRFGKRPLSSITPSDIEAWLASLEYAPSTKAKALQILRGILDLARRDRLMPQNAAAEVKPPPIVAVRPTRALSDDEALLVLQAAEKIDPRNAIVVHLMLRCGLRIGEALALRRQDLDLESGKISVRTSMSRREGVRPTKGRHSEEDGRTIPIPPDTVERLVRHLKDQPVADIGGFLITGARGRPLSYPNWRSRTWVKITKQLDFDVIPHDLRRTTSTRLFQVDRWTPPEVQLLMGHRDPRVTLSIYTKLNIKDLPEPSRIPGAF
jgi:integrase